MDANDLRTRTLREIDRTRWIPTWGRDRITGMIANRPDWCLSRQRAWGVPVIALRCKNCGQSGTDAALARHVAGIFDTEGADAWFSRPVEELVPKEYACPGCHSRSFERETDILDVWFDSGVSYAAVIESEYGAETITDLYLEGSDQHRGWFHRSKRSATDRPQSRADARFVWPATAERCRSRRQRRRAAEDRSTVWCRHPSSLSPRRIIDDVRISTRCVGSTLPPDPQHRTKSLANLYDFDPARAVECILPSWIASAGRLAALISVVAGYERTSSRRLSRTEQFRSVHERAVFDIVKIVSLHAAGSPERRGADSHA
jgi:hypothetical protein